MECGQLLKATKLFKKSVGQEGWVSGTALKVSLGAPVSHIEVPGDF